MSQQEKKPIRIGIMTCSFATQEMDCCSVSCLRDMSMRAGAFQQYPADRQLRLVGIMNCAGCPSRVYPEKILRKVESLASFGVTQLHFANCMLAFCPFIKSYFKVIKEKHPGIELVEGTHEAHISNEAFREMARCTLEKNKKMPDMILDRV